MAELRLAILGALPLLFHDRLAQALTIFIIGIFILLLFKNNDGRDA